MATWLERTKMIFHGAFNRDPTTAELARMAEGLLSTSPADYAAKPDAEKVQIAPRKCRQWIIREVMGYEAEVAGNNARVAAIANVEATLPDSDL